MPALAAMNSATMVPAMARVALPETTVVNLLRFSKARIFTSSCQRILPVAR